MKLTVSNSPSGGRDSADVKLLDLGDGTYSILTGSSPRRRAATVTPDNSTTFVEPSILWIGTAGDLTVVPFDGTDPVTYKNVPVGEFTAVEVKQVRATGTTAADIVREY